MRNFYSLQVIDLRFQFEKVTPKENRLFEEYETTPEHTNLFFY